jgi:hypothetical protein
LFQGDRLESTLVGALLEILEVESGSSEQPLSCCLSNPSLNLSFVFMTTFKQIEWLSLVSSTGINKVRFLISVQMGGNLATNLPFSITCHGYDAEAVLWTIKHAAAPLRPASSNCKRKNARPSETWENAKLEQKVNMKIPKFENGTESKAQHRRNESRHKRLRKKFFAGKI